MRLLGIVFAFGLLSELFIPLAVAAGPRVDIVIGEKAPALERLAADELASQLKRIYEADVKIDSTVPADSPHVIFVGSPDTNASMKPFANSWPSGDKKLTDQGHLLRSVTHNNKPALLIGGGSPVATYWAVAEFGHRLGIRSMLFGDLDPVAPPPFRLDQFDAVIEPTLRSRGWYFWNSHHSNSGAWTVAEYRRTFQQLTKLRFNRVTILIFHNQPYLHLEYAGIKRAASYAIPSIVVSGDTAGRKAFGGVKVFEAPAYSGAITYSERHESAKKHLRDIIDAAHEFGLAADVDFPIDSVPRDFEPLLANVKSEPTDQFSQWLLDWTSFTNNERVAGLFRAHIRSLIDSYPRIDGIHVMPFKNDTKSQIAALTKFLSHPGLLHRVDGQNIQVTWTGISDEPVSLVRHTLRLDGPSRPDQVSILRLVSNSSPVAPRIRPQSWEEQWQSISKHRSNGFEVHAPNTSDFDLAAYWLSRNSLGEVISPKTACRNLLTSVCGEDVDERVWRAFELMEEAARRLDEPNTTPEIYSDFAQEFRPNDQPPPPGWSAAKEGFLAAMNEMYRANTRAREGGRAYTLYFARRFEFAFEYMNCIEAVRKAQIAEQKKDTTTQIAELERAIESLNNGLNAMAAVARSNSDRGLIALLNENGYRPLKKKLAEAEAK